MKKKILLSILVSMVLLLSFSGTYAQKSADKYFYYKFIQLPSHPLGITKYDYVVYQNGENSESAEDDEYNYDMIEQAYDADIKYYYERMFQLDQKLFEIGNSTEMKLLKKQLEMGTVHNQRPPKPKRTNLTYEDQMRYYAIEMKLHDARIDSLNNAGLKMIFKAQLNSLLSESKPVRPYLKKASAKGPYRLPDAIISKEMNIRGLERVYNDTKKIFFEISMSEFETKEEKKQKMSIDHQLILKYRRVVGYKVLDENKNIIDEGLIPGTDKWREKKFELSSTKTSDIKKKKIELENSSANEKIRTTKHFLASRYGHPLEQRGFDLNYAKGKNFNYDSITKAYDIAANIFENTLSKENSDLSGLKDAISIWEEELKEADYSNKKARISNAVATGLYFNIIESSIWINDFDKALHLLGELSKMDVKSRVLRKIDYCRNFILDRKKRYQANHTVIAEN